MSKKGSVEVGLRLKNRRTDMGWSRQMAAEKLEISHTHYVAIENGDKDFSKALLIRIVTVFSISADFVLFGTVNQNQINDLTKAINKLPNNKRQYANNIIRDLLNALYL